MKGTARAIEAGGREFLLRVETSSLSSDYAMYEALREEVWGFPEDHMSGTRNMMCESYLHEGGSLFIGAFTGDGAGGFPADAEHLAAFCYGFVGVRDKGIGFREPANLRFYSQFAAVRPRFRGLGLGVRLKEYQAEMVLGLLGVGTMICTYDPLTAVNADRNIRRFGMDVLEYRIATYGEYGGHLNRTDVPSDRFLMSWDLTRRNAPPDLHAPPGNARRAVRAGVRRVRGRTRELELETVEGLELEGTGDVVLVRIPADFYVMLRETDVEDPDVRRIPSDWRSATRRAFTTLLARGYRIADFRKPGPAGGADYIMMKKELP